MKINRRITIAITISAIMVAALSFQVVFAAVPVLVLPSSPVNATYGNWLSGANSTMDVTLSNVGTGFDVTNGVYPGWCIQDFVTGLLNNDSVMLYSSYDPNMPADVQSLPWNEINYVLNHKQGGINDVQIAIWFLLGDPVPSSLGPVTPDAQAMIDAANANPTYEPGPGDIVAVVVYSDGMGTEPTTKQETIIEVTLPNLDFGDLPTNYDMTTLAQDGARHRPGDVFLGSLQDVESDGLPNANATGDDLNNLDDEDGIQVVANPPDYWRNGTGTVQVTVSGGTGCLFAWVDVWNSNTNALGTDGDFGDSGTGWSEAIIVNRLVNPGSQLVSFDLPIGAATYPVWARFRLAPAVDGSCAFYDTNPITTHGFVDNGEVEDYYFNFTPTAISLASFTAQTSDVNRNLAGLAVVLLAAAGLLFSRRALAARLANH